VALNAIVLVYGLSHAHITLGHMMCKATVCFVR
jgi:hypothetical protein